jgi:Hamartin protein
MSLTVLVMLLPNICNAISEQIPQLFFILYRIVCWKKSAKTIDPTSVEEVEESTYPIGHRRENWDAAGPSEDSLRTPSPKGDQLFTFLYGLFPVNLLKFLQSPQEYLEERHIFISPLDEETFKSQAETILSRHTFNPDILKYTLDSEINDSKKWIELEPSEIATKCSSLDSTNKLAPTNANRQSQPPTGPLPKPPMVSSLLSKSLDIEAQRTFPFGSTDLGQPSSWMPRSRNGTGIGVGTSYIDEGNSIFSPREGQTSRPGYRTSLTSGLTSVPQGTEQIGGFNNEEEVKPREFAQDAPFNSQRTSTSENSQASNEDKKRNSVEDVAVPPEALASLEMYFPKCLKSV